jgi:hypothetical protein
MALITDWSYTKYIVGSSLFFQIPALYAYHHNMYAVAASCCLTSVLSINYWRHATYSWRRTMDMYWAKSAGIYFFLRGIRHHHVGILGTIIMIYLYYQSCNQFNIDPYGKWYLYHMAFHSVVAMNQLITIYFIKQFELQDSSLFSCIY